MVNKLSLVTHEIFLPFSMHYFVCSHLKLYCLMCILKKSNKKFSKSFWFLLAVSNLARFGMACCLDDPFSWIIVPFSYVATSNGMATVSGIRLDNRGKLYDVYNTVARAQARGWAL